MAVTTEPPWVHKSQGVAPRNGTTSHTINFTTDGDAPFTPATGSLLLVYIGGGVTNAASGWTEVEQPVSSGELSAFTIVSAPTTSITVTHNGSNYPCPWVVKEYPSGSVVTSSTSSNTSNDTFPTLSGLTGGAGNERVIDAAFLRVADGGESGFSAVWGSSFVEDADQYIAQSPTDGAGFTSGHLINVTATSSTPTITPTYGGTWTINDREKVVLAINAVAPPSGVPFTKNVAEVYRVFNTVTKDTSEVYRVTNAWTKDQAEVYRVTNALTVDKVERYRIYGTVTKDTAETYRVLNALSKDTVERYRVLNGLTKDTGETYRVLNGLTVDKADSYRVFNGFTKDITDTYTVLNSSSFLKDAADSWRVYNGVAADTTERYRVLGSWALDRVEAYRVTNALALDRADSWRVYGAFTRDLVERYRVLSDTPTPPLPADARAYLEERAVASMAVERATAYL